jgi:hypothetical protein
MPDGPDRIKKGNSIMIQQIKIESENMATLVCPECRWSKKLPVHKYINEQKEIKLKIRCVCGCNYIVALDRRNFVRKETDLYGTFIKTELRGTYIREKTGLSGEMTILDLSRGGLRFKILGGKNFELGDYLFVEFHLDDFGRSRVLKKALIKALKDKYVSVEFIKSDESDYCDQVINAYMHLKN